MVKQMKSTLYLIPTSLGLTHVTWLLEHERQRILPIKYFAAENCKTARAHLKALNWPHPINQLNFFTFNKNSGLSDAIELVNFLDAGYDVGLLSEAGYPAIADPGSKLVSLAHDKYHRIAPLIGPSSIFLALAASGMNAQRFTFHGYLPKDKQVRFSKLKNIEEQAYQLDASQIFMETPYRNDSLLQECLTIFDAQTRLAIACDLTLPTECIISQLVKHWPVPPYFNKRPCIFICGT